MNLKCCRASGIASTAPIQHEHIHFFLTEAEMPKAVAWYAKTFGGKAGTRNNQPVVDVPGVQLRFAKADAPQRTVTMMRPGVMRATPNVKGKVVRTLADGWSARGLRVNGHPLRLRGWVHRAFEALLEVTGVLQVAQLLGGHG